MTSYVAMLRAVNVGGTGALAMNDLRRLCEACRLQDVTTYIQSGNVVFRSRLAEAAVKRALERALEKKVGKPVAVLVRTAAEMAKVVAAAPFAEAPPNRVLVLFVDEAPPRGALTSVETPGGERLLARGREIFIHYPEGMGRSKLKLPFQKVGTARNLNTVRKLAAMAGALGAGP